MQLIINDPKPQQVRWMLKHPTYGYLGVGEQFRDDPHGCLYFDGVVDTTEEEIKDTFEHMTDIPLDQFDCIGMYEPEDGFSWE